MKASPLVMVFSSFLCCEECSCLFTGASRGRHSSKKGASAQRDPRKVAAQVTTCFTVGTRAALPGPEGIAGRAPKLLTSGRTKREGGCCCVDLCFVVALGVMWKGRVIHLEKGRLAAM